jgi:flagellar basal-body rod protein FlgB
VAEITMSGLLNFATLAPIGSSSRAEQGLLAVTHQDGWENSAEGAVVIDPTMQAIQTSLDGLAARQRIIAQNLANSETPGYISQNVNFEDSLRSAMASGDPGATTISTSNSTDPTLPDGNNVNVDTQTVSLIDTGLRYQLATQSMNNEFSILSTSLRQDL